LKKSYGVKRSALLKGKEISCETGNWSELLKGEKRVPGWGVEPQLKKTDGWGTGTKGNWGKQKLGIFSQRTGSLGGNWEARKKEKERKKKSPRNQEEEKERRNVKSRNRGIGKERNRNGISFSNGEASPLEENEKEI